MNVDQNPINSLNLVYCVKCIVSSVFFHCKSDPIVRQTNSRLFCAGCTQPEKTTRENNPRKQPEKSKCSSDSYLPLNQKAVKYAIVSLAELNLSNCLFPGKLSQAQELAI